MTRVSDLPLPASPNGKEVVVPVSRSEWRQWLESQPDRSEGVWVVFRKGKSALDGPVYMDLVLESLCFGWIDSVTRSVDADRQIQWFSPRRPGGIWSALNKERIAGLEAEGLMTDRGRASIEAARADGSWSQLEPVEALVVPPDMAEALAASGTRAVFDGLSVSVRKTHLWSVYSAKRPETRAQRIAAIIDQLG